MAVHGYNTADDVEVECADNAITFNIRLKKSLALIDTSAHPINFDIGIPGLGLAVTGNVKVQIGFDLKLYFGISVSDGFYFDTSAAEELRVDFKVTIPGLHAKGSLLFLEEVREAPYRIDRMLTQLQQSVGNRGERDGLKRAAGIMLGVFTRSRATDNDASLTLEEVLDDHFATLPIPAVSGYSFGHIPHQFTIPMGINARLDTQSQTLTLLEAAVQG